MTVDLIERLRMAKGADRELDRALLHALEPHGVDPWLDEKPTASIDSALALVEKLLPTLKPPGNLWGIEKNRRGLFDCYVSRNSVDGGHWLQEAEHQSPAIGLLIALLTALQGQANDR